MNYKICQKKILSPAWNRYRLWQFILKLLSDPTSHLEPKSQNQWTLHLFHFDGLYFDEFMYYEAFRIQSIFSTAATQWQF